MAIGKLCRKWAQLETAITHLFLKIGGWDYRLPAAYPMVSFVDFRDKIAALRVGVLAWNCREDIVNLLFESLAYIDNELRNSRNQLVHDIRATSDDGIAARHFRGAYSHAKEPGSGKLILKEPTFIHMNVEEIQAIIDDVEGETTYLFKLYEWFRSPHDGPLGPLLTPPQRQHLLRQREKQSQKDKSALVRKHPQKSSQE